MKFKPKYLAGVSADREHRPGRCFVHRDGVDCYRPIIVEIRWVIGTIRIGIAGGVRSKCVIGPIVIAQEDAALAVVADLRRAVGLYVAGISCDVCRAGGVPRSQFERFITGRCRFEGGILEHRGSDQQLAVIGCCIRNLDQPPGVIRPRRTVEILQVGQEVGAHGRMGGTRACIAQLQRDPLVFRTGNRKHHIGRRLVDHRAHDRDQTAIRADRDGRVARVRIGITVIDLDADDTIRRGGSR